MALRIAVDAMGGDYAPSVVVEGAVQAVQQATRPLEVVLIGPEAAIHAELDRLGAPDLPLQVVHAPDVIGMDDAPATALKAKPQSSIHVGLGLVKQGRCAAFATAGNTGAAMAAALFILGRLPGVLRPSLPGYFPTTQGTVLVIDVGANVDCKPEHLVQFARMGSIFVERVFQCQAPRVGLLNVGEEPGKGTEAVKEAHRLLGADPALRFTGNIEGRDILRHHADVVVCDGFVGNIMLKLGESIAVVLPELIGHEIKSQQVPAEHVAPLRQVLHKVLARFNYETFGGVPLLGIDGNVVIGHGSSSARAIAQMIQGTQALVEQQVTDSIRSALGSSASA